MLHIIKTHKIHLIKLLFVYIITQNCSFVNIAITHLLKKNEEMLYMLLIYILSFDIFYVVEVGLKKGYAARGEICANRSASI